MVVHVAVDRIFGEAPEPHRADRPAREDEIAILPPPVGDAAVTVTRGAVEVYGRTIGPVMPGEEIGEVLRLVAGLGAVQCPTSSTAGRAGRRTSIRSEALAQDVCRAVRRAD